MKRAVVTGAGRGIGLELARQLLANGFDVVGWCHQPTSGSELQQLFNDVGRGVALTVDVADSQSVRRGALDTERHGGPELDLLVNNAGIGFPAGRRSAAEGPLAELRGEALLRVLHVNAVGPALVTQALVPLLRRAEHGATVVNVPSDLGSISGPMPQGNYAYAMSKAALNMLPRKLAVELDRHSITVVALHPGSIRTRLGGPTAALDPQTAVARVVEVLSGLDRGASGRLFGPDGAEVSW
jgi:NAD(P)-dependent dehydrogenase (short-subunit alcohol dehydrogenase family)